MRRPGDQVSRTVGTDVDLAVRVGVRGHQRPAGHRAVTSDRLRPDLEAGRRREPQPRHLPVRAVGRDVRTEDVPAGRARKHDRRGVDDRPIGGDAHAEDVAERAVRLRPHHQVVGSVERDVGTAQAGGRRG